MDDFDLSADGNATHGHLRISCPVTRVGDTVFSVLATCLANQRRLSVTLYRKPFPVAMCLGDITTQMTHFVPMAPNCPEPSGSGSQHPHYLSISNPGRRSLKITHTQVPPQPLNSDPLGLKDKLGI